MQQGETQRTRPKQRRSQDCRPSGGVSASLGQQLRARHNYDYGTARTHFRLAALVNGTSHKLDACIQRAVRSQLGLFLLFRESLMPNQGEHENRAVLSLEPKTFALKSACPCPAPSLMAASTRPFVQINERDLNTRLN